MRPVRPKYLITASASCVRSVITTCFIFTGFNMRLGSPLRHAEQGQRLFSGHAKTRRFGNGRK